MQSTFSKSPESRLPSPESLLGNRKKTVAGGVLFGLLAALQVPKLLRNGENEKVKDSNELSLELNQSSLPPRPKLSTINHSKTRDRTEVRTEAPQNNDPFGSKSIDTTSSRLKDYIEIIVRDENGERPQRTYLTYSASTAPGSWEAGRLSHDKDEVFRMHRPKTADPNDKVRYSVYAPLCRDIKGKFFYWRDKQVVIQLESESY